MHSNRFLRRAVPFILALVVVLGTLPNQIAQAQDPGPGVFLPIVNNGRDDSSDLPSGGGKLPPINVNDGFFVSANGSSRGDGSKSRPWDLETALDQPSAVKPGDTLWLTEGTYGSGGSTVFKSRLQGAEDRPIVVRAVPGHRVRINGTIHVMNPWSVFWGLEVMNSDTDRTTREEGSHPGDISRKDGFDVFAPHTFLINNIIHDTRQGVGFWSEGPNSVMVGNVIYNNGWMAPDRGHGHGVYTQNESGLKWIRDNIIFSNFSGYNVHVYATDGVLNGFRIDGNTLFNGQFVVGGQQNPAQDVEISGNLLYNSRVRLGYQKTLTNQDLIFQNNYVHQEEGRALEVRLWRRLQFSGNHIVTGALNFIPASSDSVSWDDNDYFGVDSSTFAVNDADKTWNQWLSSTGFDRNSSYKNGMPTGVEVFVQPNEYEAKRANITVYNWDRQDSVAADLSATGLQPGDHYTLHNAQDYYGDTVSGVYEGGAISIPMRGWSAARPIGYDSLLSANTFPVFGAFVLTVE